MKIVKMHKGNTEAFDDFLHQKLDELQVDNDLADKYFGLMNLPAPEDITKNDRKNHFKKNVKYLLLLLLFIFFSSIIIIQSVNKYNSKQGDILNKSKKAIYPNKVVENDFKSVSNKKPTLISNHYDSTITNIQFNNKNVISKNLAVNNLNNIKGKTGTYSNQVIKYDVANIKKVNGANFISNDINNDSLIGENHISKTVLIPESNSEKKLFEQKQILQIQKTKPTQTADSLYIIW